MISMLRSVGSHVKRPLCHGFARSTNNHLFEYRLSFKSVGLGSVLIANARIKRVRYRSHATYSRQPRQVRKEATVTGSCVCSESPVPDLIFSTANLPEFATSDYPLLHSFTTFFAQEVGPRAIYRSEHLRSIPEEKHGPSS